MLPIVLLTLAPSIAICIYIYWQDKFDKEPKRLLVASFFLGVLSVVPTLIFSFIGHSLGFNHESNDLLWSVVSCIIGIGLVEEYSKFMFVRFYGYNKPAFNEPFDGITYSVMVAMGFATFENILYVSSGGMGTAVGRMFTAVPAHASFGIIAGYFLGLQKSKNIPYYGLFGVALASVSHGLYDFFLFKANHENFIQYWLVVFALSIYFSFRAIRLHQANSPHK